jgi:hypothetical protein
MKAFLDSLDVGSEENDEESDASSETTINPQRNSLAILDLILKNIFLDLKIYELKNLICLISRFPRFQVRLLMHLSMQKYSNIPRFTQRFGQIHSKFVQRHI